MTLAKPARQDKRRRIPTRILVGDTVRLPDVAAAAARLPAGTGVLLRPYGAPDRLAVGLAAVAVARRRRLVLLVAADWRLAARLGAAGLHLPEGLARHGVLSPALGWVRRRRLLLTVAAHSPAALARARCLKAHAALLSPVFPTASHPGAATLGETRFGLWARRAGLPVLALGGINDRTWRRLAGRAAGAAAIGAFRQNKTPRAEARGV
ncbi:thiamine phosphate synthase [Magnetospirillum sp. UT-4]|uniref:thiamine phosphate synthase n=1 Tax=Magnetospirillum sp. UT-4 TaxID=2681467 RepID=UPI0015740487|nr:thiamine phosphate synthase [Magnetospirillum sp. UT-4]